VLFAVTALCAAAGVALSVYTAVHRGAVIGWYPYPFIDVTRLGYAKVTLNCVWVALLLLGLAAVAVTADRRLPGPAV
jgi:hypothetical protein